ncbi:MAG TPA: type I-B CRISPR-associated protein Cas5b [Clostridiales bacterium]|nr:type I-B CRISPR-associated protein Cas5b [Clostridiales bacterium]
MDNNALKFNLSGNAAFYKKPDVNAKIYFTYNNIHKVALLGMLGAVIGLKGYRNNEIFGEKEADYPEFYEKLHALKVSIVPNSERGYFTKKIQYFNNSVGYASNEEGGNLMIFEQWLENPSWSIYLLNDAGGVEKYLWDKLYDYLITGKSVYIPYLGKNDFPANISDAENVDLEPCTAKFIHSLFIGELDALDDDETIDDDNAFIFTEYAPAALEKGINFYKFERMIYTNCKVKNSPRHTYKCKDRILSFY